VRRVPATSRLTVPWVHEAITLSTEECLVMEIWGINPEPIDKEDRPWTPGKCSQNNRDQRLPVATAIRSIRFW
jgi:hypothetical protein